MAEKIWRWEYVELGDLLPENGMFRAEEGSTNPLGVVRRRRQITDVDTWVQCFAVYIGVMSHKYPEAVPELLAYMILIVRSSREFAELTWARYDTEYRRHAANSGNRQWSRINPSMYAVHFTGKAQASTPRYELCASVFHLAKDCPFSTKTEMEKTLEAVLSACTSRAGGSVTPANPGSTDHESSEVCRKWNDERCNYQWCRYRHSDEIHVSRFGVIPKGSSGKWRLILDLSSPEGASVNDGIDSGLCSLKYATVDQAAELMLRLGRVALMAKADIEQAYRRIPVHLDDRGLLGMRFEGATYMDTVLPFGLRSAPKVFNAVADALEWVCRRQGVSNILHYLDDFFTIGSPHTVECISNLAALRTIFNDLGVPLAEHKTVGPATSIVFLGINLDSCSLQLSLPEEKLRDLKALIQSWVARKVTTARDLKSLVGKLENACKVVRPGRLEWRVSGGRKILESAQPDVVVHCDASGSIGCAAWWSEGWLHYEWPPEVAAASITPKETLPVVFACAVWGQLWRNKLIRVYCDNEAAVANLNSGRSKEPWSMHMIRCLIFIKAIYGLELEVLHLPGKMNTLADALSFNEFAYFYSQDPEPAAIRSQHRF
eukprot:Em0009g720a